MSRSLCTPRLFAVGTALLLAGGIYRYYRHIRTQQEQPFGHYTRQQIIDRTMPLCQTILGQTDGLMLSTERLRSTSPDGRTGLWRHLPCTDGKGMPLAEFFWDARTGDLSVTTYDAWTAASPGSLPPEQAKGRAAWLSYRWLCRLGMSEGGGWRLMQEPERSAKRSAVWYTHWRSSDHQARVQVNAGSGELVSAHRWPLSPPTLLRAQ
jgi:hypothetical protein